MSNTAPGTAVGAIRRQAREERVERIANPAGIRGFGAPGKPNRLRHRNRSERHVLDCCALAWAVLCLTGPRVADAQVDSASSLEPAIAVISRHEQVFRGLEVSYTGHGARTREELDEEGPEATSPAQFTLCQSDAGEFAQFRFEDPQNSTLSEQIVTSGAKHFQAASVNELAVTSILVDVQNRLRLVETNFFAKPIGGGSLADLRLFSSLLKDPSMRLTVDDVVREGAPHTLLKGSSESLGDCEFWIAREPEPHLVRAVIRKTGQNFYSPYPGGQQRLADPLRPDPAILATLDENEKNQLLAAYARNPGESAREEIYEWSAHESRLGRLIPTRIRIASESTAPGGGRTYLGFLYLITDVTEFKGDDSGRARFRWLRVPDGTPAIIKGSEGQTWVFVDGDIQRVVDDESLGRMDGVRFRKPRPRWPYYAGVGAAALFFGWLYHRARRRKNGGNP